MKQIQKRIPFENCFVVSSTDRARGLTLFWKEDVLLLDVHGTDWYIAAKVVDKDTNDH